MWSQLLHLPCRHHHVLDRPYFQLRQHLHRHRPYCHSMAFLQQILVQQFQCHHWSDCGFRRRQMRHYLLVGLPFRPYLHLKLKLQVPMILFRSDLQRHLHQRRLDSYSRLPKYLLFRLRHHHLLRLLHFLKDLHGHRHRHPQQLKHQRRLHLQERSIDMLM